jgi:ketosteroid isomerase-like protein
MTADLPHPAPEDLDPDQQTVWDAMRAVYAAFLAGDAAAADAHLHPEVTLWDSAEPGLVRGLGGLRELRARRATGSADTHNDTAADTPADTPADTAADIHNDTAADTAEGDSPRVVAIEATEPLIDIWGDIALMRHLLRVRHGAGGPPDEIVRNTSVWCRVEGRWLAVHNHEDVLGTP